VRGCCVLKTFFISPQKGAAMPTEKAVSEKSIPWTKPKVIEMHKQFDSEFDTLTTEKDVELLLQKYFGFTGLIEEALRELAGSASELNGIMETAFELISFRAYIYTCFFLNHFKEEAVSSWWEEKGFRSWSGKEAFSNPVTAALKEKFDTALGECRDTAEFHRLKDEYVGPTGEVAKALASLEKKPVKDQIEIGADLFNFKSYVDYSMYAIELSMKSSHWTDPDVRGLVYRFERDLFTAESEEDVEKVVDAYFQKAQDLRLAQKKNAQKDDQIKLFEESLQRFKTGKH
jgi:hypothetical protein